MSNKSLRSSETKVNLLVALNHHGLELNMRDLKDDGTVVHVTAGWRFPDRDQELIRDSGLRVIHFPLDDMLTRLGARAILSNVLLSAYVWAILGQTEGDFRSVVREQFAKKQNLLELNMRAVQAGYS